MTQVQLVNYIRQTGVPNIYGARIPLPSNWNLPLLYSLAQSTSYREVAQFLTFGWPLNHDGRPVSVTMSNHASAVKFPQQIDRYISKEVRYKSLLGPFIASPWQHNMAISPMSTRPKKGSENRRILMDMSWPQNGESVNDGIATDTYLHQPIQLTYPMVDMLCKRANKVGKTAKGWKKDMDRAFKQIYISPECWPLQGIFWNNTVFYDKTAIMGCCSALYVCQRTTNFIRHVMTNLHYYVDDFMGIEIPERAWQAYNALGNLLRDMGVSEAKQKSVPPCTIIEFLGVLYNLQNQTISVTPERMQELLLELQRLEDNMYTTLKNLEKLLGKLQFVSNCVRRGRILVTRLRDRLREMHPHGP